MNQYSEKLRELVSNSVKITKGLATSCIIEHDLAEEIANELDVLTAQDKEKLPGLLTIEQWNSIHFLCQFANPKNNRLQPYRKIVLKFLEGNRPEDLHEPDSLETLLEIAEANDGFVTTHMIEKAIKNKNLKEEMNSDE